MQTKIIKISYHCIHEINKKQKHKVHRYITKQKNLKPDYQDPLTNQIVSINTNYQLDEF